jgi:hypothetical protein
MAAVSAVEKPIEISDLLSVIERTLDKVKSVPENGTFIY